MDSVIPHRGRTRRIGAGLLSPQRAARRWESRVENVPRPVRATRAVLPGHSVSDITQRVSHIAFVLIPNILRSYRTSSTHTAHHPLMPRYAPHVRLTFSSSKLIYPISKPPSCPFIPSLPRVTLRIRQDPAAGPPDLIEPALHDPALLPGHPLALELAVADAPRDLVRFVCHATASGDGVVMLRRLLDGLLGAGRVGDEPEALGLERPP